MSTTPNTPALSANLPAQVMLASEHVTDSSAKALARAAVASPTGQDQPTSDGLGHACAELAALIPALIPALSRDTPPGRPHRPVSRQRRQPRRPARHDHPRRRDPRRLRRCVRGDR